MKYLIFLFMLFTSHIIYAGEVNLDSIFHFITKSEIRNFGDYYEFKIKCRYVVPKQFIVNSKSDTLYLRESIADDGNHFYYIWNKDNAYASKLSIPEKINIKNYINPKELELIESWNVEKLRIAGISRDIPTPAGIIERRGISLNFLTRIIIRNGFSSYETISYYDPLFR